MDTAELPHLTGLTTLIVGAFTFYTGVRVAIARARFGVRAPAVSGHPAFERAYRVQMNTLEWLPIFLPAMWLFALYVSDGLAAVGGLVWVAARVLYMIGYTRAPAQRAAGFGLQSLTTMVLWVGALAGVLAAILRGH